VERRPDRPALPVSQVFVSKLRKGASHNGYEMKPRKVKRGDTVYEMQARTKNGRKSDPDDAAQTPDAAAPACDRVGLPLPAGTAAGFASAGDTVAIVPLRFAEKYVIWLLLPQTLSSPLRCKAGTEALSCPLSPSRRLARRRDEQPHDVLV
jgi:hypothetical protein